MTVDSLLKEGLQLSPEQRCELADALWQSVNDDGPELTQVQREELRRRLEKHRSGESKGIPWEEFLQQLRSER